MEREDDIRMKLIDDQELSDEAFSDDNIHIDKIELQQLKVTKGTCSKMNGFIQLIIFLMVWAIMIGICMLTTHIMFREDPNRQKIILVALSGAWIILSNLLAFNLFVIDKCQASFSQVRMSEALVQILFLLGGVIGGWVGICITCYKPPGFSKMSGFMCRSMLSSACGLTIIILLLLKVLLPNLQPLLA